MQNRQTIKAKIPIDYDQIVAACKKLRIIELSLLGSVLRDDFQPDSSDIDMLVVFHSEANWILFDLVDIEDDFKQILGREVDLVERVSVEQSHKHLHKNETLSSLNMIYAAS